MSSFSEMYFYVNCPSSFAVPEGDVASPASEHGPLPRQTLPHPAEARLEQTPLKGRTRLVTERGHE